MSGAVVHLLDEGVDPHEVAFALQRGADPINGVRYDNLAGAGLLQVVRSVDRSDDIDNAPDPTSWHVAVLPYLVISQTIPLIALAPLIVSWGGKVHVGGLVWERWMSASLLGAFLTFFPIAVGTLRGLQSPSASSIELMESLAAVMSQSSGPNLLPKPPPTWSCLTVTLPAGISSGLAMLLADPLTACVDK